MVGLLAQLGDRTLSSLAAFGRFWRFFGLTLSWLMSFSTGWVRSWRLIAPVAYEVGTCSLPVIMVTGTFVGMVLAVQAFAQFAAAGLEDRMGVIINLSVVRELGPVLAGVMLAGRVGGALTAQLGTMNVTEQIEALRVMGADPVRYLVVPRFLACVLLTPFLTIYCDVMGALGGWFITVKIYGVSSTPYWQYTRDAIEHFDIWIGLIKSVFFGAAIAMISCYKGFYCRSGAEGVGRACTESFVASFMVILILDFFIEIGRASCRERV